MCIYREQWLNTRIYSVWRDRKQIGNGARWDRQLVLPKGKDKLVFKHMCVCVCIRNSHITVKFKQKANLAKTGVSSSVCTLCSSNDVFIYCWWCKQTYSLKADGQTGPPHHRESSSSERSGNTQALDTEATLEAACLYSPLTTQGAFRTTQGSLLTHRVVCSVFCWY